MRKAVAIIGILFLSGILTASESASAASKKAECEVELGAKAASVTKKSGRFFTPITIDELKAKINAAGKKHPDFEEVDSRPDESGIAFRIPGLNEVTSKVSSDLGKVQARHDDAMETTCGPGYAPEVLRQIVGFHQLPSGLSFLGVWSQGDCEITGFVYIIYWDGSQLRAYIPSDGNTWNKALKAAYEVNGEYPVRDHLKDIKKHFPGALPGDLNIEDGDEDELQEALLEIGQNLTPVPEKILADINARITRK